MWVAAGLLVLTPLDDVTDSAMERLAREMASWKAIELRVREDMNVRPVPGIQVVPESTNFYHYIETSDDRRFVDETSQAGGAKGDRISGYCDGSRCADVSYRAEGDRQQQVQVIISKQFRNEGRFGWTDRPAPLKYFHVGLLPLYEALPKAQRIGEAVCLDRPCDVFLFPKFKTSRASQDFTYYLDRATGVPLKVEAFKDEAMRQAGKPAWVWRADSLDDVQGFHIPLTSSYQSFNHKNADDPITLTSKIKVETISYNNSYEKSQFWPTIQPGVTVHDAITKRSSTVPGPIARTESPAGRAPTAGIIVATPPRDWIAYVPPVGLGLGLVVLIAGLVLWWKRQP